MIVYLAVKDKRFPALVERDGAMAWRGGASCWGGGLPCRWQHRIADTGRDHLLLAKRLLEFGDILGTSTP
jgi:hypothetical protein